MNKFYISCGQHQRIVLGYTALQACMKSFGWFVEQGKGHIGLVMRTSERGFDVHEDDKDYPTSTILSLICYNNQYNEEQKLHGENQEKSE